MFRLANNTNTVAKKNRPIFASKYLDEKSYPFSARLLLTYAFIPEFSLPLFIRQR
jgi:hypothetical protein